MKIIVAHPAHQHEYKLVSALIKNNVNVFLVTSIYYKRDSFSAKLLNLLLDEVNKKKFHNRYCVDIADNNVFQIGLLNGLFLILLRKIDKKGLLRDWIMRISGKKWQIKVAKMAIKNEVDAVIAYDTHAEYCFRFLKKKASTIIRILDNAHPARNYLFEIYNAQKEECGEFYETFNKEPFINSYSLSEKYGEEIKLADYHIVASSFSEKALLYNGIERNRILLAQYGVNAEAFKPYKEKRSKTKLNVLFVGVINQRKGIRQILEAARIIDNKDIVFNLVGEGYKDYPHIFKPYFEYVNFWGRIEDDQLFFDKFQEANLFIYPTMGEGFGFSLLQAMAAGLPVITTAYCGGGDFVKDGYNGFLIESCDTNALVNKILWANEHKDELEKMGDRARATAINYTWSLYNQKIGNVLDTIFEQNR